MFSYAFKIRFNQSLKLVLRTSYVNKLSSVNSIGMGVSVSKKKKNN